MLKTVAEVLKWLRDEKQMYFQLVVCTFKEKNAHPGSYARTEHVIWIHITLPMMHLLPVHSSNTLGQDNAGTMITMMCLLI